MATKWQRMSADKNEVCQPCHRARQHAVPVMAANGDPYSVGHMLCHKIHFRPRMPGDLDVILSNNKDFAP